MSEIDKIIFEDNMKILAVGAHPDDIEIFMYGFLAKCRLIGDSIFSIVVTDGAAGDVMKKNKISYLPKIRQDESISALNTDSVDHLDTHT